MQVECEFTVISYIFQLHCGWGRPILEITPSGTGFSHSPGPPPTLLECCFLPFILTTEDTEFHRCPPCDFLIPLWLIRPGLVDTLALAGGAGTAQRVNIPELNVARQVLDSDFALHFRARLPEPHHAELGLCALVLEIDNAARL